MNLVKCPRCGEEYSPSYRTCPFCEEEERPRKLRNRNRSGHRVTEKKKTHSGKGALITILILVLALLTWYLFGEQLLERFAQPDEQEPPVEDTTPDGNETDDPFYDPVTGETGDPNAVEPPVVDEQPAAVARLRGGLRDQLLRQLIVKIGRLHTRLVFSSKAPLSPAARSARPGVLPCAPPAAWECACGRRPPACRCVRAACA